MSKRFDIVVHGATGYTGRLVTRALLSDSDSAVGAPKALKWAISGRNERKLLATKEKLKEFPEVDAAAIDAVPILVADSMNEAQIVAMVKQTKVVVSVVGPYKLYGEALVKACAENGVHYCDLSGEAYWIREMIDKYEATAKKTGAKLVNCCGFGSVPSDLTAFLLADSLRSRNETTSKINLFYNKLKGGASGGAIASGVFTMDTTTPDQQKAMENPFYLTNESIIAEKEQRGLVASNSEAAKLTIKKEPDFKKWSSTFFNTQGNSSIVHRSNYLLSDMYGDSFVYRERFALGGLFAQLVITTGIFFGKLLFACGPIRRFIGRHAMQPGDGPSEEALYKGSMEINAFAYDAKNSLAARATVTGVGDPGYLLTSRTIAECAKCLATDETTERGKQGGFLTPASAFGHSLSDRLERKHIFSFELKSL